MPKNIKKSKELKGLFIHQDKYHGTVYYDIFTKNGYILSDEDVKLYTWSIAFLPLTVILFYFLLQFGIETYTSLAISIGFYIIAQIIYRFMFLYKLPCVEKYNKEKNGNIIDSLTSQYSKPRLIVLLVFLIALIGVTIAYILTSEFTGIIRIALWVLVGLTFIFFIIILIALTKKK